MIGHYATHAQTFLLVLASVTTLGFAIPIFLFPLKWARLMHFSIPDDDHLAIYFGRCLGAFILVIEWIGFRGAFDPAMTLFAFQTLLAVFGMMLIVHLYGWIRNIQPVTENLENIMWAVFILLALLFWPVAG